MDTDETQINIKPDARSRRLEADTVEVVVADILPAVEPGLQPGGENLTPGETYLYLREPPARPWFFPGGRDAALYVRQDA